VAEGDKAFVLSKTWGCYQYLGFCTLEAKVFDYGSGHPYEVILDEALQPLSIDSSLLANSEAEARFAVVGTLDEELIELLEQNPNDAKFPIVVWLRTIEYYPEKELIESDPDFAATVETHQTQVVDYAQSAFIDSLPPTLSGTAVRYPHAPAVYLEASKYDVLWLSNLEDVAAVYPWKANLPLSDAWYGTDIADCSLCNTASGARICVIEPGRPDNTSTLTIASYMYPAPQGVATTHAQIVLGVIRSSATVGGGMAAASTDYMGNWDSGSGLDDAGPVMNWCGSNDARSWNFSHTSSTFDDRLFDYWARHFPWPFIAGAAGNDGINSVSGNTGFNVACVGGTDDHGDDTRSNDTIYDGTSSKNPTTAHNDRELPIIAAPAVNISAANMSSSGTSLAAPQIAAGAAQLQTRNTSLKRFPEAVRAILMATADQNVDGPVLNLNDQTDDRDGAGELNMQLATSLASSSYKVDGGNTATNGGHDYGTMSFSSDFDRYGYYSEVYNMRTNFTGLKARVVLTWDSTASCQSDSNPASCSSDTLDGDLDLYVLDLGNAVEFSTTWDNSYEFLQFSPIANHTYQIKIHKVSSAATSTYFGLAFYISSF